MIRPFGLEVRDDFGPRAIEMAQRADRGMARQYPLAQVPLRLRVRHIFVVPVVLRLHTVPTLESVGVAQISKRVLVRATDELIKIPVAISRNAQLNSWRTTRAELWSDEEVLELDLVR